jgi:hypothetical protein
MVENVFVQILLGATVAKEKFALNTQKIFKVTNISDDFSFVLARQVRNVAIVNFFLLFYQQH